MTKSCNSVWEEKSTSLIINIHEAKTHLSRLLERAHAGQEIILAKAGKPYEWLMPLAKEPGRRQAGRLVGRQGKAFFEPRALRWLDHHVGLGQKLSTVTALISIGWPDLATPTKPVRSSYVCTAPTWLASISPQLSHRWKQGSSTSVHPQ